MASGGIFAGGEGYQPTPIAPTSLFGNPSTFTAAANTQGSDYDKIMAGYENLAKSYSANPLSSTPVNYTDIQSPSSISPSQVSYNPITAQTSQYKQSDDVTSSLAKLSDLATTGGYSEADKQNIRERDISPIRSIYANAQQNTERAKALGGGYSPNFNAVTSRMARDEADKIGDITTSANANIAQNVAANRLAAASPYASASASANAAKTAADQRNADIINQINELNTQNQLQAGEFNTSNALNASEFNTQAALDIAKSNAQGRLRYEKLIWYYSCIN